MTLIPAFTPLSGVFSRFARPDDRSPLEGSRNATTSTHIPALDGIRGIAVLLVLVTHFCAPLAWAVSRQKAVAGKLWIASHVFDAGWVGVDLFFVLSGFLITGILADAKGRENYFRNFYARRSLRVFPLYYGVLMVTCVLLPLAGLATLEPGKQAWLWSYGVSLFPAASGGAEFNLSTGLSLNFTHFWSLAVEEHFYLVWPLLVLLLSRRSLMKLCVAGCAAALIARTLAVKFGASTPLLYELTFFRMDGLLAGAWVALAIRGPGGIGALVPSARRVLFVSGVTLTIVIALAHGLIRKDPRVQTIGFSALAVFFASGILLVVASPGSAIVRNVFCVVPLRTLGKYSYGIYVYHGLLLPTFDRHLFPVSTSLSVTSPAYFASLAWHVVGSTVMTIVIAVVSYHLFEAPFLTLKRFFSATTRRARVRQIEQPVTVPLGVAPV